MHVSPSQIATWRRCCRLWAYSRIRSRTTNQWADFGIRVHKILERWLTKGEPPDASTLEGRCALAMLPHLPMPAPSLLVEQTVRETWDGVDYLFQVDLTFLSDERTIIVWDHKTIGDLANRKTAEELRDDPQWIVYGRWASRFAPQVVGVWGYGQRRPPGAQHVVITATRDELEARWQRLHEEEVRPLLAAYQTPLEQIPRNFAECWRFRRPCEHLTECHAGLSPVDVAAARLTQLTPHGKMAP